MQIEPKASAPTAQPPQTSGQDSRARAIAALMGSGPQGEASPEAIQTAAAANPATEAPVSEGQAVPTEPETKPAEDTAAKPEETPLSSQYAKLAKKEAALVARAREMKAREDALKARETALQAPGESFEQRLAQERKAWEDRLVADPLSVLSEKGLTWDQLTEKALSQQSMDPATRAYIAKMEEKLAKLEEGQTKAAKAVEEQQSQAYKQAVETIRTDVRKQVYASDTYELVKATNSVNDVVELIEKTFQEGLNDEYPKGTILDNEVALQMVEDYLAEEALKVAKLKKIQSKLAPAASPGDKSATPAQPTAANSPKQPQTLKTLTNQVGTTRQLSARERALLAFKGELK